MAFPKTGKKAAALFGAGVIGVGVGAAALEKKSKSLRKKKLAKRAAEFEKKHGDPDYYPESLYMKKRRK